MRQEETFMFAKGLNMCFYHNVYEFLSDDDFENLCDNITEKEDSGYYIDIIFSDTKEDHKDWLELACEKNNEYLITDISSYKGKSNLVFTELLDYSAITFPKYIYIKASFIPEEEKKEEKYPSMMEGIIYTINFQYQNKWLVNTQLFSGKELSELGNLDKLCNKIANGKKSFSLEVVCSNRKGIYKDWIELSIWKGFEFCGCEVHGLEGYKEDEGCPTFLFYDVFDFVGFIPRYIYLKKV